MCGIGAIIRIKNLPQSTSMLIESIGKNLAHRGPDDEGYIAFQDGKIEGLYAGKDTKSSSIQMHGLKPVSEAGNPQIMLAHRRLSIIDTSSNGWQPMSYDNGRYWIVYNGELYNYQSIRDELIELGFSFATRTDTEVIVAAYKAWGDQMVSKFFGMWAFLIYDCEERRIMGSRDRFGVKPLYFIKTDSYVAIASEQKALVNLPVYEKKINRRAAFDFLVNGALEREPNGMFDGITELTPSSSISYTEKDGLLKTWHYFGIAYKPELGEFSEERLRGYAKKLRRMLSENISSHLMSDVQMGLSLSGGIDSSTIAMMVQRQMDNKSLPQIGDRQKMFTVVFPGHAADESKWAKIVVEATKADWYQIKPNSNGFMDNLETVARTQDLPFLGMNTYSHYAMMEEMKKQGIKVTLDGQGADELFGGYPSHFITYMRDLISHGHFANYFFNVAAANNSFASRKMLARENAKRFYMALMKKYTGSFLRKSDTVEYKYLRNEFWDRYSRKLIVPEIPGVINAHLFMDFTGHTLKSLLRSTDRNSMHFGIESRTPFADDSRMAEYVFKINGIYKIQYGSGKHLLRSAIGNVLPEPILYRRDKMGFNTPQNDWFKEKSKELHDYIGPNLKDVIDYKLLSKDWSKLSRSPNVRLWRLVSFAVWRHVYGV
jgi:asparagine synthase (glutamine-hydrolysing)